MKILLSLSKETKDELLTKRKNVSAFLVDLLKKLLKKLAINFQYFF
jgi:hypothetical protein